jgi:hypothetical protein
MTFSPPAATLQLESPFHVSLSQMLALAYDYIQPLVAALQAALKSVPKLRLTFGPPVLLPNREKTRVFLALQVFSTAGLLDRLMQAVDGCVAVKKGFGQPKHRITPLSPAPLAASSRPSSCRPTTKNG